MSKKDSDYAILEGLKNANLFSVSCFFVFFSISSWFVLSIISGEPLANALLEISSLKLLCIPFFAFICFGGWGINVRHQKKTGRPFFPNFIFELLLYEITRGFLFSFLVWAFRTITNFIPRSSEDTYGFIWMFVFLYYMHYLYKFVYKERKKKTVQM